MTLESALLTVAVGICVGIVSALFGIGGGIVMVPFMVLVLGEGQHLAEGTSLLVIVPTATAGVFAHRRARYVTTKTFLGLGLAGAAGAIAGARLAFLIDGPLLQRLFALLVLLVGVRLIVQGLRREPPETGEGAATDVVT